MDDYSAMDPQALSKGTTTATIVHAMSTFWVPQIMTFKQNNFAFFKDMKLRINPNIDTHHGITPFTFDPKTNHSVLRIPSTLHLDEVMARSTSLASLADLNENNMAVDVTGEAPEVIDWLSVDAQLIAFALATENAVRLFMYAFQLLFLGADKHVRIVARFFQLMRFYVTLLVVMYIGFWTAPLSDAAWDIELVAASRNIIAFAVTTALGQYPGILRSESIHWFFILCTTDSLFSTLSQCCYDTVFPGRTIDGPASSMGAESLP